MATAHSTDLYTIGKGILKFDRFDADGLPTGMRDLGNAPNFTVTPTIEQLDHFSSREGIKKKDKTVTLSAGLTVKFTLDEYDIENLAIALFGTEAGGVITLLADTQLTGELYFLGTNDVGPRFEINLWKVTLKPTSELGFISDEWSKIDFEGTVESDETGHVDSPYGLITEVIDS